VIAAVAEHAIFLHPDTVAQSRGLAIFPVVRARAPYKRGDIAHLESGRRVLCDDNWSPTLAFKCAAGWTGRDREIQFSHVWTDAQNPEIYTALWNVFVTPAFLAKTTDGQSYPEVTAATHYRAFDLYGCVPADASEPRKPAAYDDLEWAPHPPPIDDLERALRARLKTDRVARACREIGWLFSDGLPDPRI
jgi:hypothetical protein